MMSLVAVVVALVTILSAGFGLTRFILHEPPASRMESAALSWLLGSGFVSVAVWTLSVWLHGMPLLSAIAALAVALGISGCFSVRRRPSVVERLPLSGVEKLLVLLLLAALGLTFYRCMEQSLGWDGLLVWELKARYAFLNGGSLPSSYFVDASRAYSHPEYPLFLPCLETYVYLWLGDCDQFWIKVLFPLFLGAATILLAVTAAELSGRRVLGLCTALLFVLMPFIRSRLGGAVVGYADIPLAAFYLASTRCLLVLLRQPTPATIWLFSLLNGLLPWVKREGVILWLTAGLVATVLLVHKGKIKFAVLPLLPGLIVLVGWQIFLRQMHAPPPGDFSPVSLTALAANLERFAGILGRVGSELVRTDHWSVYWYAVAAALVCLAWRQRNSSAALLAICFLLPASLYGATYVFSTWSDYTLHIATSLPRLLLQLTPVGWLIISAALKGPVAPARSAQVELP